MDNCPFCGADQDTDSGSRYIYKCRSESSGRTADGIILRSSICYKTQLAQQAELITKQQKALEMFDYLVGAMVTHTFTHGEIHQKVREIRAVLEKPWNA